MGYEMTKVLANSDVDYWRQMPAKESHQSAIFIGSAQGEKVRGLLGEAKTGDAVKIVLNRSNLIHVLTAHYEAKDQFFSSRNLGQWTITVEYLKQCLEQILAVFRTEEEVFIASVNRQTSAQNCRAWIKGLQPELKREDGTCGISIFDFLFSGDTLHFIRDDAWLVHIEIIPKVVTSVLGGSEKGLLRVGDVFSGKGNETYEVIGVEPHAYRIRFNKTGKIRTTPKTVVAAWYKFYKEHPFVDYDIEKKGAVEHKTNVPIREASSRALRDQYLNTSTEDDSFEHAYDGMLGNIARWLLDNPREEEEDPKNDAQLPTADSLTVALKMFAEKRAVDKPSGWDSYDAWTKGVREEFSQIDESLLTKPGFDYVVYLRKYSISWQVVNTKFAPHTSAEKHAVLKFLREQKESPKSVSWYIDDANRLEAGGNRVDGMSAKTLLYFMSELRPDEFAPWTEPTYEGLAFLGLHKGPAPKELTVETYEDCKAKQHQIVARMKELGIGKASDDATDPDYRTVNEFLWWLGQNENKDLIKEKIMSKKMKTEAPKKYDEGKRKKLAFDPNSKDDELLLRLLAALRAKPFAILAGHSGTGKSRYVKKLAYMTCNMDELRNENQLPGNYLLLQVKPNWHDSTELLGFRNAMDGDRYQKTKLIEFLFRAYQFKDTPFFLCLDEMNLAPVEQYFAEFLSSMESAEPVPLNDITVKDDNLFDLGCEWKAAYDYLAANGFSIPKNLFIVGTVNMDETTNQFSRKVLDRAFTIEMTDVDFKNYGHVTQPSYADTIEEEKIQALLNGEKFVDKLDDEDVAEGAPLVKVQKALEPTAFAVAYRFANEYTLLKRAIACFDKDSAMKLDALDQAVLMKILPRVAGEKDYIEKVYGKNENEGLRKALEGKSVSLKKIAEIMKRANDMNAQYITFWP